jgi:hypothetical protein
VTLLVAAAGIAALPVSLHFEGNEGTAEPFLVVFPVVALLALVGALIALRRGVMTLFLLNLLLAAVGLVAWIGLLTIEGD